MKKLILFICLVISKMTMAQSITISPSGTSAMLDASATNKGVLISRVSLSSTTDVTTIANPVISLLVYNTNASMAGGSTGYYYWDGTNWTKLIDSVTTIGTNGSWTATGNNISNANSGNVGVGLTNPITPLQVQGAKLITIPNGGTETSNVTTLISDATASSAGSSKIGLYASVKNHAAVNVGIITECVSTNNATNYGIISNISTDPGPSGNACAIAAVDAIKSNDLRTFALKIDGKAQYTGVPFSNLSNAVLTNAGGGLMQWSDRIAFKSTTLTNTNITTGSSTIPVFTNTVYGNLPNGVFTAPIKGVYHFDCALEINLGTLLNTGVVEIALERNGGTISNNRTFVQVYGNTTIPLSISDDIDLLAGETVNVRVYNNSNVIKVIQGTSSIARFSGHLIR